MPENVKLSDLLAGTEYRVIPSEELWLREAAHSDTEQTLFEDDVVIHTQDPHIGVQCLYVKKGVDKLRAGDNHG